jgi:hypothetical protein
MTLDLGQLEGWLNIQDDRGQAATFPIYRMADERYISCTRVLFKAQTGRDPGVFCGGKAEMPETCSLAGGPVTGYVPCAFCDPDFDWQRMARLVKGGAHLPTWQLGWYESPEAWAARGDGA